MLREQVRARRGCDFARDGNDASRIKLALEGLGGREKDTRHRGIRLLCLPREHLLPLLLVVVARTRRTAEGAAGGASRCDSPGDRGTRAVR